MIVVVVADQLGQNCGSVLQGGRKEVEEEEAEKSEMNKLDLSICICNGRELSRASVFPNCLPLLPCTARVVRPPRRHNRGSGESQPSRINIEW